MNLSRKRAILAISDKLLDKPPMFRENLSKEGPLLRRCLAQNSSMWAARARALSVLCIPLPREGSPSVKERCVFSNFRTYTEDIVSLVGLMLDTGLPCFRGETLKRLR